MELSTYIILEKYHYARKGTSLVPRTSLICDYWSLWNDPRITTILHGGVVCETEQNNVPSLESIWNQAVLD